MMFLSVNSNTTGDTSGAGTAYSSGLSEFNQIVSGALVVQSLVFCIVFCRSLFVIFLFPTVLSVL